MDSTPTDHYPTTRDKRVDGDDDDDHGSGDGGNAVCCGDVDRLSERLRSTTSWTRTGQTRATDSSDAATANLKPESMFKFAKRSDPFNRNLVLDATVQQWLDASDATTPVVYISMGTVFSLPPPSVVELVKGIQATGARVIFKTLKIEDVFPVLVSSGLLPSDASIVSSKAAAGE